MQSVHASLNSLSIFFFSTSHYKPYLNTCHFEEMLFDPLCSFKLVIFLLTHHQLENFENKATFLLPFSARENEQAHIANHFYIQPIIEFFNSPGFFYFNTFSPIFKCDFFWLCSIFSAYLPKWWSQSLIRLKMDK